MPRVTAVIPAHNGAAFIGTAIRSVLAQTCTDLEVLVADDGSSDETVAIVESFGAPVRLIRVRHGNTQATRNAAIAASDSEFVGLLDQDDTWWPQKLERQLALMDADRALGLCYTDTRGVDPAGQELSERHNPLQVPQDQTDALGRLLRVNIMAASTVLLRRSVLTRVGTFDPAYHLAGDWDLWLRLAEEAPIAAVPQVLIDYCWHGGNLSHGRIAILAEGIAVQETALERIARHPRWSTDARLQTYLPAARRKLAARCSEVGLLYARAGRRAEALTWHGRALRLAPWTPRAWSRWARAFLGRRTEAGS
ncbi:glycosyltransferase [uncultured Thiodictyon sp.]|uniref:glycosyltransferase family 2 protein n=1 Tax=uncultured Thiodictyon sp. TaxID=1846217 RepID=UPI0025E2B999|nr:glycosyltransferase [uncultured Thiodictyon sp.]